MSCLRPLLLALLLTPLLPAAPPPALAQETGSEASREAVGRSGLPLPRFASLRASEVNLRTGPGIRYPIEWVYRRRGLPVEIIDEFENWRRIRDWEGTVGWVHQSMLQGRRTVRVMDRPQTLYRAPDTGAPPVAVLEPGAIGEIESCEASWCRIEIQGFEGWLKREAFYGTYAEERLE